MGLLLAATAARDRAASRPLSVSGTAFVAQVAVGISENGGGSRRRFGVVLEMRREKNIRISNKALKVQIPADGALTLTADVGSINMIKIKQIAVILGISSVVLAIMPVVPHRFGSPEFQIYAASKQSPIVWEAIWQNRYMLWNIAIIAVVIALVLATIDLLVVNKKREQ